jgi:regulation of enolase protein 1 (concanavalin A-like superfamily)
MRILPAVLISIVLAARSTFAGDKTSSFPGWGTVANPDCDCSFRTGTARLIVSVPGGNHDLDARPEYKVNGPRVLQEIEGDFTVEVRVAGTITADKDMEAPGRNIAFRAGALMVWLDDKNFLRLDRAGMIKDGKPIAFAYFHDYKDGKLVREQGPPLNDDVMQLRIERKGNRFIASAEQGKVTKKMPVVTWKTPAKLHVGVGAVNVSRQDLHAVFEDLKITTPKK